MSNVSQEIITIERSALDRWIKFDPDGYLDLMASDVMYFDPNQDARVDGADALRKLFAPLGSPHYGNIGMKAGIEPVFRTVGE